MIWNKQGCPLNCAEVLTNLITKGNKRKVRLGVTKSFFEDVMITSLEDTKESTKNVLELKAKSQMQGVYR